MTPIAIIPGMGYCGASTLLNAQWHSTTGTQTTGIGGGTRRGTNGLTYGPTRTLSLQSRRAMPS